MPEGNDQSRSIEFLGSAGPKVPLEEIWNCARSASLVILEMALQSGLHYTYLAGRNRSGAPKTHPSGGVARRAHRDYHAFYRDLRVLVVGCGQSRLRWRRWWS